MMHQFDHRWATYERDGSVRDATPAEKVDPSFVVLPRYWVHADEVTKSLGNRWDKPWLLGWRDIARATDERTLIAPLFPMSAVGNKVPLMLTVGGPVLAAILNSFATDYVARQSVSATSLNFFIVKQIATLNAGLLERPVAWLPATPREWILTYVLELSYTAYDMRGLAEDLSDDGEPFVWDEERRAMLRTELDAAFFHLYGLPRDEVDYVMQTFPIVCRKDEAAYGEYRTKRLILESYDAMSTAIATGTRFQSSLDPAPGAGPRHAPRPRRIPA